MLTRYFRRSGLLCLLVLAALGAVDDATSAKDLNSAKRGTTPDVTGAVDARGGASAEQVSAASRARAAMVRFSEARAAMEHGLRLRETAPANDVAAVRSGMKDLLDDLAAVEQADEARIGSSAKNAERLADDWYQAGMKIIAPPSAGLTDVPLPMVVKTKADVLASALDVLVEETAAMPAANAKTKMAVNASTPAAAATPLNAAPRLTVTAPQSLKSMHMHHAGHEAPPVEKPMTQNQASLRLMREALPLLIPPAALFQRDDSGQR